jgi:hypothetical protein
MLENRKAYESKLEAQLAQWEADIDVLKAKAKRQSVDAMVGYDKTIDALQRKHDEARNHLLKLKEAGADTWESMKAGAEQAWLELKAMVHSSSAKH